MRLTVMTSLEGMFIIEASEDLDLHTFKVCCEDESGLVADNMVLKFQGIILSDDAATLKSYGIADGDMVMLETKQKKSIGNVASLDFSGISIPANVFHVEKKISPEELSKLNDPKYFKELLATSPRNLMMLRQNNPDLAEAVTNGDFARFKEVLGAQLSERNQKLVEYRRLIQSDPYDMEAQKLIAEEIRMENVKANMEAAMEYIPESFGVVLMLYINCFVNGVPVKAFIDSGAQGTLMSVDCAKKCNIMRLVDTRWAGVAKGVGVQRILGRVHLATITIENVHLSTSFSVLEQSIDMLLGLDMLRRHQCCIDLKNNVLRIGTTGTETRFLPESELPAYAKLSNMGDKTVTDANDFGTAASTSRLAKESGSSSEFPQDMVFELINYGFTREQVLEQLRYAGGDKLKAMASLFKKYF